MAVGPETEQPPQKGEARCDAQRDRAACRYSRCPAVFSHRLDLSTQPGKGDRFAAFGPHRVGGRGGDDVPAPPGAVGHGYHPSPAWRIAVDQLHPAPTVTSTTMSPARTVFC